jgi:beta-glucanase (GH16 family)
MKKRILLTLFSIIMMFSLVLKMSLPVPVSAVTGDPTDNQITIDGRKMTMTFCDNFDGTELDNTKWEKVPESNRQDLDNVWDDDMSYLDGAGHLVIEMSYDSEHSKHVSGGVRTKGKFEQTYGYFEARCQLNQIDGYWSAFWLLYSQPSIIDGNGSNDTEIDVMEFPHASNDIVYNSIHWDDYGVDHKHISKSKLCEGVGSGYHTFGVLWDSNGYTYYIDGQVFNTISKDEVGGCTCSVPLFMKLTSEYGTWSAPIDNSKLPDYFTVDYVKAYQFEDFSFTDSSAYDVPAGTAGTPITPIDVSSAISGGTIPYQYSFEGAPSWLQIDSATGKITGTRPAAAALDTTATVKVTDSGSPAQTKKITISIGSVMAVPIVPTITTTSLSDGTTGTTYSQTLSATGDTPLTWSIFSGTLPDGLTLSPSGVISGTPSTVGTSIFTVKAANINGYDTQSLSINILKTSIPSDTAYVISPTFNYSGGDNGRNGQNSSDISTKSKHHFIKGANSEWESTSDNGLEFTVDGALNDFLRVEVDGKVVDKLNYDIRSGSTIIMLKPEYLKTLDVGAHKLTVVHRDGSATTNFKVKAIELVDLSAGAGIEVNEKMLSDDNKLQTELDIDVNLKNKKNIKMTTSDKETVTDNSLSGVFAVIILAITMIGIAIKERKR